MEDKIKFQIWRFAVQLVIYPAAVKIYQNLKKKIFHNDFLFNINNV